MTAGVKSGKAQNERMFFRFGTQSGHRELASMCPLGAVKACALPRCMTALARVLGASDSRRGFRIVRERLCSQRERARRGTAVAAITRRARAASSAGRAWRRRSVRLVKVPIEPVDRPALQEYLYASHVA